MPFDSDIAHELTAAHNKEAIENLDRKQLYSRTFSVDQNKSILTNQNTFESKKPTCPCCSYPLLCHISSERIYWRCGHCYQEMPII